MLWWCGDLILRICSCIILCWCGSNANFLGFKFYGFVFLIKCLMCSCLISCSCLIWCGFDFLCLIYGFVWFFWVCALVYCWWGLYDFLGLCSCVFLFKMSRSKFMYFIVFNSVFSFFYLVKIDKLFIYIYIYIRCWCGIFYNILIPPVAISDISVSWLTERTKITRVNWFRD